MSETELSFYIRFKRGGKIKVAGNNIQFMVLHVWVNTFETQVGARLLALDGSQFDVAAADFHKYRGKLENANVMVYGLRGKPGTQLERQTVRSATVTSEPTYTLMHGNDVVCEVYDVDNRVEVLDKLQLPVGLRGWNVDINRFNRWLDNRLCTSGRPHMKAVHTVRHTAGDREKILLDSCGISIYDNFWVRKAGMKVTWDELKKRDVDPSLLNTALTGNYTPSQANSGCVVGVTTQFTLKGVVPKGVHNGFLLKRDNNAGHEAAAFALGTFLNVRTAIAYIKQNGIVACALFTSDKLSLAHAGDLKHLTTYDSEVGDDIHRAVYMYFKAAGRTEIVEQLERLYIFNYLVTNMDFTEDNFGVLYDADTFKIQKVAPAFDFNCAFREVDNVQFYYYWIRENLKNFMASQQDLRAKLGSKEFAAKVRGLTMLTTKQRLLIIDRAKYLCAL
jgi:hypothetical protein